MVCRYNATGVAEGFNGNPKRRLIKKSFRIGLAQSAQSEFDYFLFYLLRELQYHELHYLDKIKLKQDLILRKMKYNLHQVAL
jgi:hypothetical protein